MNAISMLESDHRKVETLFTQFDGERDALRRHALGRQIVAELLVHADIEETHFYPAASRATPGAGRLVDESRREHAAARRAMDELAAMRPEDDAYAGAMRQLRDLVAHHVDEEEGELFPLVAEALGKARLESIGSEMEGQKRAALPR
jgi:hemerythrin superfamily protein